MLTRMWGSKGMMVRWVALLQSGAFIGDRVLHSLHQSSRCFGGNCHVLGVRCRLEFSRFEVALHRLELTDVLKTLLKRYYFLMSFNSAHSGSVLLLAFLCWGCTVSSLSWQWWLVCSLLLFPVSLSLSPLSCRSMSSMLACPQSNAC